MVIPPQINKYYISDLPRAAASSSTRSPPASRTSRSAGGTRPRRSGTGTSTPTWPRARRPSRSPATSAATDDANVAGICAGGVTMACLLGHLAATGESLVNSVTFMVAGLDTARRVRRRAARPRRPSIEAARSRSQRRGVLEGRDLGRHVRLAAAQRPRVELLGQQLPARPEPARVRHPLLERRHHQPAGRAALGLPRPLSRNGLAEPGAIEVLGTPIDLGQGALRRVRGRPGPPTTSSRGPAAYRTTQLLGGDSEFVLGSSGHIQAIVNPPGQPAVAVPDPPRPAAARRRRVAGRGRPRNDGQLVGPLAARGSANGRAPSGRRPTRLGNRRHPPIEPAPGRYVHL